MTLGLIFALAAVLLTAAILVWNFVPAIHAKVNGWTTVLELIGTITYGVLANVTGGVQDAVAAGYVPSWLVGYIPILLLVWFVYKRFMTKAPVGVPT
jgi:hypothetical protein